MGLEVREGGLRKRRRRRIRRRKSKFPHVRAYVIDPFGAPALLPPSTTIMPYLSRTRVPLTISFISHINCGRIAPIMNKAHWSLEIF